MVVEKQVHAGSFLQSLENKPVGREETFLQKLPIIDVIFGYNFLWQFLEVFEGKFK